MELTNIQREKVEELLSYYNPNNKVKIDFKAPTGSGKTLMATSFISEMIDRNVGDHFVFVIATPSSADLPFEFEQKILQYKQDLNFTDFSVEYIKSPSEAEDKGKKIDYTVKLLPEYNKVYIFGKSSFGSGRILTTRHIIDDFVSMIKDKNYKLIYIRDEAHIGGTIPNNNDINTFETLMQDNANFVIKMTATPNFRDESVIKVILSEEDLNNPMKNDDRYLLKTTPVTLLQGTMDDNEMLNNAIKIFKCIKKEYSTLEEKEIYIHPAMLVQVNNDSSIDIERSEEFHRSLKYIKEQLNNSGLSWVQYFGDSDKESNRIYRDDFTLNDITDNNSDIDVIIFKLGPATGWDIPRACMLLQLRNVCSEGLNIQTIGRIKRNCYPNLEKNDITDKYYIYSNAPQDRNLIIYNARVKDDFINEEFMSIEITNIRDCSKKVSQDNLKRDLEFFCTEQQNNFIQKANNIFIENNKGLYFNDVHKAVSGGEYVTRIYNVYQFIKIYKRLKFKYNYIFSVCEKFLYKFWLENLSNKSIHSYKYAKEMFYLVIMKFYSGDIENLINKNNQYKPKYKVVSAKYTPNVYTEIYTNIPHSEGVLINSYLFDSNLNGKEYKIPLGENENSPEVIVFNKIRFIDFISKCIKVWGKNFTTSNVNSAYLDKYNNLKHSYFDFIIKFTNNALLYIEVKGEQDINPEKTKMLLDAYAKYFEKDNVSLFDKPVVISLFRVNSRTGNITHKSFYDKRLFNNVNLNELEVEELIKTISSLTVYSA